MELREQNPKAGISIRDVLPECQIFGADDVLIRSCCHDWNQVQPGDLYVARVGIQKDGHDHIRIAAKKGAAAILCERFVVSDVPVCLVDDTREAYGELCQKLVGNPADKLNLIGVTGTSGKTIVSHLIQQVLRQGGNRTGMISSLGFCDGFLTTPIADSTPSTRELATCLSDLVDNGCQAGVLEVSSIGIAERLTSGLQLDSCVYTNVRQDHLDVHGTIANYRRIQTRLVERLKTGGLVVLNADDRFLNQWSRRIDRPTLTYGLRNPADVTADIIEQLPGEQTFLLTAGNETIPVRTSIVGDFYVRHCLAAATVGLAQGLGLDQIVAGIEAVRSLPGRMEKVDSGRGFSVYVDAARTPHQLGAMLKTLGRIDPGGRIHCVFGGADRTTPEQRAGLGTVAERHASQAIISGIDAHQESALGVAHEILDGFDNVARAHVIPNRAAAIRHALDSARPGDTVLIAGLGDRPTRFGMDEEIALTDRELCELWLEAPDTLDPLCIPYDENLPVSYPINDYR